MHKDVGYLNEPKAMWHVIHPHEGHYRKLHPKRCELPAHRLPMQRTRCGTVLRSCLGHICQRTGANRIVDKYPELIFRVDFVRALFPDARFYFSREKWMGYMPFQLRIGQSGSAFKSKMRTHDWWGCE